jgi:membrane protein implicated in regulation of membrane protease activity
MFLSTLDVGTTMIIVWFAVIIIAGVIEAMTMNLTSVWLCIAAFVSLLIAVFAPAELVWLQITVFFVISGILLLLIRPLTTKYLKRNSIKTNADSLVGMTAVCTKPILDGERGEVKIEGKFWSAISNENIQEDEKVVVLAIKGVKLVVKKHV